MTVAEIDVIEVETENVQCPRGFAAGGLPCGIKAKGGPDLAVFVAAKPVASAALFTTNQVKAAPIVISAEHLRVSGGKARALLINSGCANAATGDEGRRRADRTVDELAKHLKCDRKEVLVNSTGVIGVQLAEQKIVAGLPGLLKQASPANLDQAMAAIMTTDTRPKMAQVRLSHDGRTLHVAGVAKGAGMIHPNMATMIAVLMTDAEVQPRELDAMLRRAADRSFHRITVDGDTSTNDSVFALASGEAGAFPNQLVEDAMTAIARELALMVVKDGEGARKLIHVKVDEARNQREALQVAQTIASSLLVRTAVTGGDPNWGRILAAIGRSGVTIDLTQLRISANGVSLFEHGAPADSPLKARQSAFAAESVMIEVALGLGDGSDEFFTCDLTEGYVQVNSHYMT